MPLRRPHRRSIAAFVVGVLLCVQWLVIAHACTVGPADAAVPPALVAQAAQDDLSPCHDEAMPDEGLLCKAHCADEQQAPSSAVTAATAAHAPGWCLVVALPVLQPQDAPPRHAVRMAVPPGWPPIYLTHGVLRI